MVQINSYTDLENLLKKHKTAYLLLFKSGSEQSNCAFDNLKSASDIYEKELFLSADVNTVRDIHEKYSVSTVPVLLSFENEKLVNIYKGCNDEGFYKTIIENKQYSAQTASEGKQKSVIVYSTPTCSWCTRLKDYLKSHKIKFRDIDVSKDAKAAEEMVKRSGQQGVPQSLIGGQVIVGFDKVKIDKLLNIQ